MMVSGTHKLINSKAAAKNPFSLKIYEIILGFLVRCPSLGALERLEGGELIPELYAPAFEG